ncbi:CxxCxxCC domain-containing protein [Geobacter pickeringii]|uniref:hypothetical protein n=1 Tax=Geobacter pickeringii TaxID=345632 RepID=UPI0006906C77|nr:hypothetical protein [Geobacter pickeringii]
MECLKCATCCTAPDIAALGKGLGERCRHLDDGGLCGIYAERPAVCRGYRPDELCWLVAAPTLEERVRNYLRIFGMEDGVGATPRSPGSS